MAKNTKVFVEEFKGKELCAIWEVTADGEKVGSFPVLSFGAKKAEAIIKHMAEIKSYLESHKD